MNWIEYSRNRTKDWLIRLAVVRALLAGTAARQSEPPICADLSPMALELPPTAHRVPAGWALHIITYYLHHGFKTRFFFFL
jgi:hypothetical protein